MRLITFISTGAFIVLSAFAMKSQNEKKQTSLYETKWLLRKIYTSTGEEEINTKAFIKFHKDKQSAGGNGSCNSFGSDFSIDLNKISFKNIFSTKMYCEGVQQTENTFFKLLSEVNRFKIQEKSLQLFNDKDLLLEFVSE